MAEQLELFPQFTAARRRPRIETPLTRLRPELLNWLAPVIKDKLEGQAGGYKVDLLQPDAPKTSDTDAMLLALFRLLTAVDAVWEEHECGRFASFEEDEDAGHCGLCGAVVSGEEFFNWQWGRGERRRP